MIEQQTNFDRYLSDQLQDPAFKQRFEQASRALTALGKLDAKQAGLISLLLSGNDSERMAERQLRQIESRIQAKMMSYFRGLAGRVSAQVEE
jgi:hypothetical protein